MEKKMKGKESLEKVEKERIEFKELIIENPNYFGTFPEINIKPVLPMKTNTKYEELRCLGFYPEQDMLEAIIDVKLPYGYKGNLCSPGSFEYVRFFVDWNGMEISQMQGTTLELQVSMSMIFRMKRVHVWTRPNPSLVPLRLKLNRRNESVPTPIW